MQSATYIYYRADAPGQLLLEVLDVSHICAELFFCLHEQLDMRVRIAAYLLQDQQLVLFDRLSLVFVQHVQRLQVLRCESVLAVHA